MVSERKIFFSTNEGDIFIYSISKEINCAEHEYKIMSPSLIALATPLLLRYNDDNDIG